MITRPEVRSETGPPSQSVCLTSCIPTSTKTAWMTCTKRSEA